MSVIIPTYNRSGLLVEAVDSVLAQTHPVHEVVIVDDGSDARHRHALDTIARRSPAIRVHALPHRGERSHARNEGLARATGEYVLFLDDDDLLHPGMVASAMQTFAQRDSADVVVGRGEWIGDVLPSHRALLNPFWSDSAAAPDGWASRLMGVSSHMRREIQQCPVRVLLKCAPPINAFVARRAAIGSVRFQEDLHQGEDWMFWIDVAAKGCRFRSSSDGRVYVRRHPDNAASTACGVVACERVVARVAPMGPEEAFLATARWARTCWVARRGEWWRPAVRLARYPALAVKYCGQFLARRIYRLWLRASSAARRPTATTVITGRRLPTPESASR